MRSDGAWVNRLPVAHPSPFTAFRSCGLSYTSGDLCSHLCWPETACNASYIAFILEALFTRTWIWMLCCVLVVHTQLHIADHSVSHLQRTSSKKNQFNHFQTHKKNEFNHWMPISLFTCPVTRNIFVWTKLCMLRCAFLSRKPWHLLLHLNRLWSKSTPLTNL